MIEMVIQNVLLIYIIKCVVRLMWPYLLLIFIVLFFGIAQTETAQFQAVGPSVYHQKKAQNKDKILLICIIKLKKEFYIMETKSIFRHTLRMRILRLREAESSPKVPK